MKYGERVCSFVHCKNRVRKNGKSFYRIQAEITRIDEKTETLSQKQRKKRICNASQRRYHILFLKD